MAEAGSEAWREGVVDARSVELSANAVLRLAIAKLASGGNGIAQRALDAALGWSELLIPTGAPAQGDPVISLRGGEIALVAFSHRAAVWRWIDQAELVCRVEPAMRVVGRALERDVAGIALDPSGDGNGGVIVPRTALAAVAEGSAQQSAEAGDNLALRLAVDAARSQESALAHEALREALLNGRALVPARPTAAGGEDHDRLRFPTDPVTGEPVLVAFSDREALGGGPPATGGDAVVMTGRGVVDTVTERGFSALVLNPGEAGAVVVPAPDVQRMAERLQPRPEPD
ncbi:MAG: SseB family protein [Actinomycetota bacterium]|nr:SseB family protein [Actinomycetota bacterium]